MDTDTQPSRLAPAIVDAQNKRSLLGELEFDLNPPDREAAYLTQQKILRLRGVEAGGWKIGS
ncbi:2-keto-4-pentenoate hydratase, partial [Pseudomonas graminis]